MCGMLRWLQWAAGAGALIGLVVALDAPGRAACDGALGACVRDSAVAVARPFVVHALMGAAAGLAAATCLLLARRARPRAPSSATTPRRGPIPERVRHEVWRRDRAACVDCGSRARLEFDHIIPVSRGGSNTARNIELRCEPCNRRKGARI